MSVYTQLLLKRGYKIVHLALVAALPKPDIEYHPNTRCFVLTNELIFTVAFWTIWQSEQKDWDARELHYLRDACDYAIDKLDFQGVNGHSPWNDGVKGLELTPAEILERAEHIRAQNRQENLTEEAAERRRAYKRVENMTEEQIERRRASRRVANLSEGTKVKKKAHTQRERATREGKDKRNAGERANRRYRKIKKQLEGKVLILTFEGEEVHRWNM
ncbi:Heat shock protein ssb1 [Lithohypha guttulata]|uniref:Heat shock protein ssb1 n=1 Tax=Lithohypha guttulata TaxID=1690604 RepID=A0AAN7T357_9EURO|nr:Heat shock protein ssb1 [Lithohypha guttulata]